MKNLVLILMSFLLIISVNSQEFIKNSDKPLNPEAGRVLKLDEIYEIKDEPGVFYFRWPGQFHVDSQGCLFILDEEQLLKFSPEGRFIKNLYKKGQGPGEIATRYQMVSYVLFQDELYVYDGVAKILRMDRNGSLVQEIKQTAGRFYRLIGKPENGYYLLYQTPPPWGKGDFVEIEHQIHLISFDGTSSEQIVAFPSKVYSGKDFGMDWDNCSYIYNQNDGSLYVTHTCEYQIVRADLAHRKILISFNRKYPRVNYVIPEYMKSFYEQHNPPKKKFENDVLAMFLSGNNLWVKTSTIDKNKGILFDVFDPQGQYLDSFYLNINGELMLVDGGCIFVSERDEEENILIKKYKILNY